jgi:hypothetical protein
VQGALGSIRVPEALLDLVGRGLAAALLVGQEYAEIAQIEAARAR